MKKHMTLTITLKVKLNGEDPDGVAQATIKVSNAIDKTKELLNYIAPTYDLSCDNSILEVRCDSITE